MARNFTPVADDMYRFTVGSGPEAEFFKSIARQGHAGLRAGQTQQGVYVFAPSGEFLASDISVSPDRIMTLLRRGLDRWKELPRGRRLMKPAPAADPPGRERAEKHHPKDGLVLRVFTRDRGDANRRSYGDRTDPWNTDMAWFTADEMREFVPARGRREIPAHLVRRLARVHLLDFVRGLPLSPFQDGSVERASMQADVVEVKAGVVSMRLTGESRAVEAGRGIETRMLGRATWDPEKSRFTSFELVATGTRWGPARGAGDNDGPGGIGYVLKLAGDAPHDRVAPWFFGAYGWRR